MNRYRRLFLIWPIIRSKFYVVYNRIWFYIIGVKFGKRMKVPNKIYVYGKGDIIIGDDLTFSSGSGANSICRNIRGELFVHEGAQIIIGDRVGISSACLWSKKRITIGNDVKIGGDCIILDNDAHPLNFQYRRIPTNNSKQVLEGKSEISTSPITIDDDVWIGARCQILKGVHIGPRSIIAAGSVVVKDVPADVIAGGIPCKILKKLNN